MASSKTILEKLGANDAFRVVKYFCEGRSFLEISKLMPKVFVSRSAVSAFKRDYKEELERQMTAYLVQYGPVEKVGMSKPNGNKTVRKDRILEEPVKKPPEPKPPKPVVVALSEPVVALVTKPPKPKPAKKAPKVPLTSFNRPQLSTEQEKTIKTFQSGNLAIAERMESGTEGISLRDVEDGQCRMPKGQRDREMLCCGKPTKGKRHPYCDECDPKKH